MLGNVQATGKGLARCPQGSLWAKLEAAEREFPDA
jgi:hypothetical protein